MHCSLNEEDKCVYDLTKRVLICTFLKSTHQELGSAGEWKCVRHLVTAFQAVPSSLAAMVELPSLVSLAS